MSLDGSGKEQWGKQEYVPKPDQKSILDIVDMLGWSKYDERK